MHNLTFNPFFNVFEMKTTTLIDTSQRLHVCWFVKNVNSIRDIIKLIQLRLRDIRDV